MAAILGDIDLGNPLRLLSVFAEMNRVVGDDTEYERFGDLFGVPDATMEDEEIEPGWFGDVKEQAGEFLDLHGDKLSEDARGVLETLAEDTETFADRSNLTLKEVKPGIHRWVAEGGEEHELHPDTGEHAHDASKTKTKAKPTPGVPDVPGIVAEAVKHGLGAVKAIGKVKDAAVKLAAGTAAATVINMCGGAPAVQVAGAAGQALRSAVKGMGQATKWAFKKMKERYGSKQTALIAASAQVIGWGAFLGAGIWIPCSSVVAALPGAVIAETVKQLSGGKVKDFADEANYPQLTPEQIEQAARELVESLNAAWGKIVQGNGEKLFATAGA